MITALLLSACVDPSPPPTVEVVDDDPARIVVTAHSADVEIRVQGARGAVASRTAPGPDGTVRLEPAVPLRAGLTYEVRSDGHVVSYTVPAAPDRGPVEVQVFPSTDVVPANHLKFYVAFSQAMRSPPDLFTDQVQLLDASGTPLEIAFAHTPIWSDGDRRLTLVLHPGRQKRDLSFREALGPVLEEGERYTLRIAGSLTDAQGRPMATDVRKEFAVGPEDRTRPDPSQWTVDLPTGGAEPLGVHFTEPLDAALLAHAFAVAGPRGPVPLMVDLGPAERSVQLTPVGPWPAGPLTLERVGTVEDLAANTPERLFEVQAGTKKLDLPPWTVAFTVRSD